MKIRLTYIFLLFFTFVLVVDVLGVELTKLGECLYWPPAIDQMTGKPDPEAHGFVHCREKDVNVVSSILVFCKEPVVLFKFMGDVVDKPVRIKFDDSTVRTVKGVFAPADFAPMVRRDSLFFVGQDWIDRMKKHNEFWIEFTSARDSKEIAKFNLDSFTREYAKCTQPSTGAN